MIFRNSFIAVGVVLLFCCMGCNGSENGTAAGSLKDLKAELPGKWRAVGIAIRLADSLAAQQMLEIGESTLREKPILWEFEVGNRYRTTANDLQSRGIWNAFSDTLMMIEPRATYHYIVSFSGKEAIFRALLDWDGDGVEDDQYEGRFVRD